MCKLYKGSKEASGTHIVRVMDQGPSLAKIYIALYACVIYMFAFDRNQPNWVEIYSLNVNTL